jgi:hypothetical protein
MRFLIEIVIIAALIYLGWDTPFKEWSNRANTAIQTLLHPKRETPSGVIMIPAPTSRREIGETLGRTGARKLSPVP